MARIGDDSTAMISRFVDLCVWKSEDGCMMHGFDCLTSSATSIDLLELAVAFCSVVF